jgi:hypothetical protein
VAYFEKFAFSRGGSMPKPKADGKVIQGEFRVNQRARTFLPNPQIKRSLKLDILVKFCIMSAYHINSQK